MLDDMLDYMENLRERPVSRPISPELRQAFREPLAQVHARFMTQVLPFAATNNHPRFMGWVQGGGTPLGMLAEMLAAGLNANLGGRDQMALEVERKSGTGCMIFSSSPTPPPVCSSPVRPPPTS